jgi:tRNA nucleotidyltransferase (CCA-adding enzyme)
MKIIVGHTSTDLDAIGSMVLARRLFPDHRPVRSALIHPVARNVYNMFEKKLAFLAPEDLRGQHVEHVVVVDTRSRQRVEEFFKLMPGFEGEVLVFDHHPADTSDIPGAIVHERPCGANTTLLGVDVMNRGVALSSDEATVALIGIYADTGRFAHSAVTADDFQVAAFLVGCGASLPVVERLLRSMRDEHQVNLFHRMVNGIAHRNINGHAVQVCTLELDDQMPGLAAVVEKVFEVEEPEALFAVFGFRRGRRALIVARSVKDGILLNKLLEPFGGGGHAQAASALVRGESGAEAADVLIRYLEQTLTPAPRAADIMTSPARSIASDWSLVEASMFLEQVDHTGAPVTGPDGCVVGFLTLRDISKGRKAGAMSAPVTAYMTAPVHGCSPATTVAEVEHVMYDKGVSHLPVLEGGRLVGLVARGDLLHYYAHGQAHKREVLAGLSALATAAGSSEGSTAAVAAAVQGA